MSRRNLRIEAAALPELAADPYGGASWSALIDETEHRCLTLPTQQRVARESECARPCGAKYGCEAASEPLGTWGFLSRAQAVPVRLGAVSGLPGCIAHTFEFARQLRLGEPAYLMVDEPLLDGWLTRFGRPSLPATLPVPPAPWHRHDYLPAHIPPHKRPPREWEPPERGIKCKLNGPNPCCDYLGKGAGCLAGFGPGGAAGCASAKELQEMATVCADDECSSCADGECDKFLEYFQCDGAKSLIGKQCPCKSAEKVCVDGSCVCKSALFGAKPGTPCNDCPNCGTSPAGLPMGCLESDAGRQCVECVGKCCWREYNKYTKEVGPLVCSSSFDETGCQNLADGDAQVNVSYSCEMLPSKNNKPG